MATWMRFELTTSAVTGRHSNQLNYQAIYELITISIFESPYHLVFLNRKIIPWIVLYEPHGLFCTSCNHSMEGALSAARTRFLASQDHFMESPPRAGQASLLVEVTGLEPVTPCL